MQGERRYRPHGDAVEFDRGVPESVARQLEAIAGGSRSTLDLEAELVHLEPESVVLLVGDTDLQLQVIVLSVEIEGLTGCRLTPDLELGEAELSRLGEP